MGEEADDIVMAFGLTAEEVKQSYAVKGKFKAHFVVKRNVIFERAKFNLSINKMVSQWIICLAEYCEFGTLRDDLIRDRIVVRIKRQEAL